MRAHGYLFFLKKIIKGGTCEILETASTSFPRTTEQPVVVPSAPLDHWTTENLNPEITEQLSYLFTKFCSVIFPKV